MDRKNICGLIMILFCLVFIRLFFSPDMGHAEEKKTEKEAKVEVAPLVVTGSVVNHAIGQTVINRQTIQALPKANGDLNELLRIVPGVQFSEEAMTSEKGGEILPSEVSISGGKIYQNNFLIDGVSNNSVLDPSNSNHDAKNDVSGHSQQLFLDPDLVETIKVYDTNVPAEFGGFNGGVVDVTTIEPGARFSGNINFRITSSDWTEFYIDDEEFEYSTSEDLQPEFDKYQGGITINSPLTDDSGFLASYRVLKSVIPLKHLDGTKNQERRSDSFFVKYTKYLTDLSNLNITLGHTPYTGDYFREHVLNSDYEIIGGGYTVKGEYSHALGSGELKLIAAVKNSENSRKAPQHYKSWIRSNSKIWGKYAKSNLSKEGGYGDIDKEQTDYDISSSYDFNSFDTGFLSHRIKTGFYISATSGFYKRKEQTYEYYSAVTDPLVTANPNLPDEHDFVSNEQYLSGRYIYDKEKVDATLNSYSFFLQDKITVKRVTIHPGIRFSYNDYMENFNISPRFSAEYDIFGSGNTVMTGGVNRYYGRTLLTYKLREGMLPKRSQWRTLYQNVLQDWQDDMGYGKDTYRFSKLKTPYNDEYTVGVDQKFLGGILGLKYVNRQGKNQFSRKYGPVEQDGLRYSEMTNNGTTDYWSVRATWSRSWMKQSFFLNFDYQETNTTNEDYDTLYSSEETDDRVYYNGKILYREDLPRDDYNRPFTINMLYTSKLPWGFVFSNFTKYRAGYENLGPNGKSHQLKGDEIRYHPITGEAITEEIQIYEKKNFDPSIVFDWKISWSKKLYKENELELHVDVNNVFNEKIETGIVGRYGTGRQFWLGLDYKF